MSAMRQARRLGLEVAVAFQFLTRIPLPSIAFEPDALARAIKFFPIVGLAVGSGAVLVQRLLLSHLSRSLVALVVLVYLVLITGCLHEDGLADIADGFGGGWSKEQILVILKDSRIGVYGARLWRCRCWRAVFCWRRCPWNTLPRTSSRLTYCAAGRRFR